MPLMDALEPLFTLVRPLYILWLSLSFLPATIVHLVKNDPSTLVSWSGIKNTWFARFWSWFGPQLATNFGPAITPLLSHATGTVLDIGPGQGHFLTLYPKDQITKIYAVEPNKSHHQLLRANAKAAGLLQNDQFEIVDAHIETLSTAGINRGSIDTICTLQTLCSISNSEILIPELRTYLKRGSGKWIVFEHVRRPEQNGLVVLWQRVLNIIWPECLNGCHLTRRTDEWIQQTGSWREDVSAGNGKLAYLEPNSPYSVVPTVCGVLVSE